MNLNVYPNTLRKSKCAYIEYDNLMGKIDNVPLSGVLGCEKKENMKYLDDVSGKIKLRIKSAVHSNHRSFATRL